MNKGNGIIQRHNQHADETAKQFAVLQEEVNHLKLRVEHLESELGTDYDSLPKCEPAYNAATPRY